MIINLTQHPATPEQIEAGVVDMRGDELAALRDALTFSEIPDGDELETRAGYIASLAVNNGLGGDYDDDPMPVAAMVGGAPYLMAPLERALSALYIRPVYAFSVRESVEQVEADGSVRKVNVFRHMGFVG